MVQGIDIPGINWETGTKGTMDVDGEEHDFMRCPLPKASIKDEPIFAIVDINRIPEPVFQEILLQGLKALVNRGPMTKITGTKTDDSRTRAINVAQDNIQALYEGKIRLTQGLKESIPRAVKTLALNNARFLVREHIKAIGERVSHYKPRLITEAAERILNGPSGKELIDEAREELARRAEKAKKLDLGGIELKPDAELVAKDKAKSKKKPPAEQLSASALAQGVATTHRPEMRR